MVLTNLELKIILKYGKIQTSGIKMPEYLSNVVHFDVLKKQSLYARPVDALASRNDRLGLHSLIQQDDAVMDINTGLGTQ